VGIKYLLGIDTAVYTGSIALFAGPELVSSIDSGISRSENLLVKIQSVLNKSSTKPTDLDAVVVSLGPGSFTGIRIGIATLLGLKASLSAECFGISVIDAIKADPSGNGCIPIVPLGRHQYLIASNSSEYGFAPNLNKSEILDESELIERVTNMDSAKFILPKPFGAEDAESLQIFCSMTNVSFCQASIAQLLCRCVLSGEFNNKGFSPIYAQR